MHRTTTRRRPAQHVYIADPTDPAVCVTCALPERNNVHQLPDTPAQHDHRKKTGDK